MNVIYYIRINGTRIWLDTTATEGGTFATVGDTKQCHDCGADIQLTGKALGKPAETILCARELGGCDACYPIMVLR